MSFLIGIASETFSVAARTACSEGRRSIVVSRRAAIDYAMACAIDGVEVDPRPGAVLGCFYGVKVIAEFDANDLAVAMHCDIDAERCS